MKNNLNPLYFAVKSGLGTVAAMGLVATPFAVLAQDQAGADEDEIRVTEEVIVTGSRIKRADIDSASPVTVLEREELLVTGMTDVGDILQRMPSMSGSPIGTTTNNGGNGAVLIDLRGMGVNRTVTLVNGKRIVDGGDFQTIPSTMIERVEILKDGASAIYGADAVAGVVNIITRRDFEGVEFTAQTADWFDAAGKQDTVGVIAGFTTSSGNFLFGAEFVNQEAAYQSDTDWDFFQNSYYIYPGGCEVSGVTDPWDGTASGGCYPVGSSRIPQSRLGFLTQGTFLIGQANTTPYEVGIMAPHDGRTYNYAPVNFIQTPYERTNVFAEGHFDITDDIRFNAEFRANYRNSKQELAPMPYNSPTDPAYDGIFNGVAYSGISEDNYYLRRAVDAYNAATGSSLIYEPVRDFRRRMIETTRSFTQDITQYQFVAGLEGQFNNDIDWEIYMNWGDRSRTDEDFGQFSGFRLFNALGPSADLDGDGMPECYTDINDPTTLITGCVPFNAFGGGEVDPLTSVPTTTTVTQDMVDYLQIDLADFFQTKQVLYGASVSGSNFELPGGELGWAVGYGYWKQEFTYAPDSAKQIDAVTGNVGVGTKGQLVNDSVFLELLAPVFDNGTQALNLKAGFRWDDYDAFDDDTTWQFGAEFNATEDLKFRATAGTVFRAPTIGNLFGGQVDSFPTYVDPCIPPAGQPLPPGCAQMGVQLDTQLLARVGGNPNLQPETGDTLTAGLVWTPTFGDHGFTVTLDYWEIDLEDGISSLGVQFILDDCYLRNNASSCSLITRRSDYSIGQVIDGALNVAEQGAKGIDTEVRWTYNGDSGQWQASMLWAHLMERTKTANPTASEIDLSGRTTDPTAADGGTYAEDKVNATVQWLRNDLSVGYLMEYISGVDGDVNFLSNYIQDIDSQMYHDLFASYDFQNGVKLSVGVTNVTDEEPPYIDIGFNASTDPSTYRLFGRGYYARVGWKF